jgi:hypothetical protein
MEEEEGNSIHIVIINLRQLEKMEEEEGNSIHLVIIHLSDAMLNNSLTVNLSVTFKSIRQLKQFVSVHGLLITCNFCN